MPGNLFVFNILTNQMYNKPEICVRQGAVGCSKVNSLQT
jgi:hypothetical protein